MYMYMYTCMHVYTVCVSDCVHVYICVGLFEYLCFRVMEAYNREPVILSEAAHNTYIIITDSFGDNNLFRVRAT